MSRKNTADNKSRPSAGAGKKAPAARLRSRLGPQGSYALFTILIALLVLAVMFFAQRSLEMASDKAGLQIDMTKDRIYKMSEETLGFVDSIDKDIRITVLANEALFEDTFPQQLEIIRGYARENPRISLGYVDVVREPAFLNKFVERDIEHGDVLVECGSRYHIVKSSSLYSAPPSGGAGGAGGGQFSYSDAENAMNTALVHVISEKVCHVAFIRGHNEIPIEKNGFAANIEDNAFSVSSVSLAGDLSGVDILVCQAPAYDFSEDDLRALDRFLTNGGNYGKTFCFFPNLTSEGTPQLNAFLKEWGISVSDKVVYEWNKDRFQRGAPLVTYASIGSDAGSFGSYYSKLKAGKDFYILTPYSFKLDLAPVTPSAGSITTRRLLVCDGDPALTTVENATSSKIVTSMKDETAVEYTVLALSTLSTGSGSSRVMVSGGMGIVSDTVINAPGNSNSRYIVGLFRDWTDTPVSSIYIPPKNLATDVLQIGSYAETVAVFVAAVFLPPAAIVLAGCAVYFKRRHL